MEHTKFGNYLFVPYGPTSSSNKAFTGALEALKSLGKYKNATFIRIEPTTAPNPSQIKRMGLKKIQPIDPEVTWVLDLTQSESDILAGMKQNNRNLYRNHAKKGMKVGFTTDPKKIKRLTSLLSDVSAKKRFGVHDADYLAAQMQHAGAKLYYVEYKRKYIAAALVYDSPTTRYYAHAAADYNFRNLNAGTVLVAQMIFDAQSAGLSRFDFWGITSDDHPNPAWAGFTRFKKSFGGHEVRYSGTWDLPLKPFRYRLFRLFRWANRLKRRLARQRSNTNLAF